MGLHWGSATINPDGAAGWRGGFPHKNAMAPFMVFAILVLTSLDRPSLRRRAACLLALVLIVMSQSTSALAAGVVVLVACVFLRRFAASETPGRASLLVGGMSGVLVAALLSSTLLPLLLGVRGKDSTLTGRTDIWREVWRAIQRRPWTGYGIGGVWSDPSVDPARSIVRSLGFVVFHAHDGFLEILLLLGVVGLALFVWLLVSTIRLGLVNLRHDTPMAVLAVGYSLLVIVYSISEVIVFGIWLAVLAAFNCLITMADADRMRSTDAE
jgi:O-antigen ligase